MGGTHACGMELELAVVWRMVRPDGGCVAACHGEEIRLGDAHGHVAAELDNGERWNLRPWECSRQHGEDANVGPAKRRMCWGLLHMAPGGCEEGD